MQRESSSSQNRKAGHTLTHTHTHTHTHTLTHRTTAIPSLLACGGEGNDNQSTVDCSRVRTRIRVRGWVRGSTVYGIPLRGLRRRLQSTGVTRMRISADPCGTIRKRNADLGIARCIDEVRYGGC